MNQFGGYWTEKKMEIVVAYARAYLKIMKKQAWVRTIYFDGFAGSGTIGEEIHDLGQPQAGLWQDLPTNLTKDDFKKGTALRILDIADAGPFDQYYFVEKNEVFKAELQRQVKLNYPGRNISVIKGDCNDHLKDLGKFMKTDRSMRALVFIDPYGMALKWSSIEALKGIGVDLWILVPTGLGVNRILVKDGEIPKPWMSVLESFLGLERKEIKSRFYRTTQALTLFNEEVTLVAKEKDSVIKLGQLYSERLKEVFSFVSEPFVMRNSMNSIMYHFMMATNNATALKIANDVIKPNYKL